MLAQCSSKALGLRAGLLRRTSAALLCHAAPGAAAFGAATPAPRQGRQQRHRSTDESEASSQRGVGQQGARPGSAKPSAQGTASSHGRSNSQAPKQGPSAAFQTAVSQSASPITRAAAAAAAPAARSAPEPPPIDDPTYVPRARGIKDGAWNSNDEKLVKAAADEALLQQQPRTDVAYDSSFVLLGKTVEQLSALAVHFGQPAYRGAQLRDAMLKGAHSLDDINNIPKDFREKLRAAGIRSGRSILHHSVSSPDGTKKYLLQLHDGRVVECVGIPVDATEDAQREQRKRLTVCVSSQVGCPMRCTFCATGKGGFARNLLPHEIMDQVMTVQEQFGERVTNVVFMGMGEPLLNTPNVIEACKLLNTQIGIGARFITISTVGVPNTLPKLSNADIKATLAVSIHAPNQTLREKIIPSAKAYPLEALIKDLERFYLSTKRRITFEYTLLAGVNDQDVHAKELASLLKRSQMESHVNVIPWNPVDESEYQRPSRNRAYAFQRVMQAEGIETSLRITRGLEAAAACGQLRNQHQKVPLEQFAVPT